MGVKGRDPEALLCRQKADFPGFLLLCELPQYDSRGAGFYLKKERSKIGGSATCESIGPTSWQELQNGFGVPFEGASRMVEGGGEGEG